MPTGDDALDGIPEMIPGRHIFHIESPGYVQGTGVFICIRHHGQEEICKDTGEEGKQVGAGDEVEVYKASVHFKWT